MEGMPAHRDWLEQRLEQLARTWSPQRIRDARAVVTDLLAQPPVPYAAAAAERAPRLYAIADRRAPPGVFLKVGKTTQALKLRLGQHLGGAGVRGGARQGGRMLLLYMAHTGISDPVQAKTALVATCVVYWTRRAILSGELHEQETLARTVLQPRLGQ
jgi:hypothetical protein